MRVRALVMELLRMMELASVIRVTGVMIVRKAMRVRMDQVTNGAKMEEHLAETFQTVHVIVQGQITKEIIAKLQFHAKQRMPEPLDILIVTMPRMPGTLPTLHRMQ